MSTDLCLHEGFLGHVEVTRMPEVEGGPVMSYCVDVTISCRTCGERFVFIGLPAGSSPNYPTVSWDGTELRSPIMPRSMLPSLAKELTA